MRKVVCNDTSRKRRSDECRRRNHVKAFFRQFYKPRRRSEGRRETDIQPSHLDFHEPALLAVVLITLSLCIFDVYATLLLLQKGGTELNPLMQYLIDHNLWWFYGLKYTITAACLFVLLSYKRFRLFRNFNALHALYGVLVIYVMLAVYQVKLLSDLA